MEKIVFKRYQIVGIAGRVEKIDDKFVYFLGNKGRIIIPKENVLEISEKEEGGKTA